MWFQVDGTTGVRDTSILDVPATSSAADNYVHGLVTVNDAKGSETREMVSDMIRNGYLNRYTYTGDNVIQAQEGNATSGSEDRLIPISGDSQFPTERKGFTLNLEDHLLQDLVTTRLNTLDSVLVTTQLVSHCARKSS